ncbi:MAG: GHKL domain-containing protein, partial [Clostridia bacterium]|nr:GHKL domain-containing protein [Clostridia bacterium]
MIDILRTLSLVWSVAHVLVLFMILFEPRYSKKKNTVITIVGILTIIALNVTLAILFGTAFLAKCVFFTIILTSLIFFFILSKYRDGRFLFTFCVVDTVSLAVIILTAIIDKYLLGGLCIFMFASRLIAFPLLEWFAIRKLRRGYRLLQDTMKRGWWCFALVSALFYLLMVLLMNYPKPITENPSAVPAILLVIVLMPLMYFNIFQILYNQQKLHEITQQKDILYLERDHMESIIKQNAETEERIRIERHDLRHRMKSILSMLENAEYDEAVEYIRTATHFYNVNKTERHCQNPILDAVFSVFFSEAEANGIRIESSLAIPNELSVDATELSVVFANALENAIHACKKLPESERVIKCKYVIGPRHMFQISNPYVGDISLDRHGRPSSNEAEHGIGTRSIVAFCEKYNADLNYKIKDGWFNIRIIL